MRRFECAEQGAAKFWQVTVEGADLTVTFGRLGTAGQSKTKTLASEAAAEREAAKLIREKTGKGYVEVSTPAAEPSKAEAITSTGPETKAPVARADDLFGVTARKLQGAATKIAKAKRRSDVHELLHRAGVPRADCPAATWHVAASGLAPVAGPLLEALDVTPAELTFEQVERVARRVEARPSAPHEAANWLVAVLRLAQQATDLDATRAASLGRSLPDAVRGAFVIVGTDAPTDEELALALAQLTGSRGEFAFDNGVEFLSGLMVHVPLDRLEWVLAPRQGQAPDLLTVRAEVPRWLLARRDTAEELLGLAERLRARVTKPVNQGLERAFEAAAMAVAMHRLAEAGAPIPEGIEATVPWSGETSLPVPQGMFNALTTQPALAMGLAALPRERALALAGDDPVQALLVLAVHPDPERLASRLASLDDPATQRAAHQLLAGHDAESMVRALHALLGQAHEAETQRTIRVAACAVLDAAARRELELQHRSRGRHVARAESLGEHVDELLTTDSSAPPGAWSSSIIESLIRRLPPQRRDAVVLRMLANGEPVERLLTLASYVADATLIAILDGALAAPERVDWAAVRRFIGHVAVGRVLPVVLAAHTARQGALPPEIASALGTGAAAREETALARLVRWSKEHAGAGPSRRVYAMNRREGPVKASRVEGPGPAIDRGAHGIAADAVHALTLDLAELPELAARFPDARLFSVYAPNPAAGEWDEGWVVTSPALPDAPRGDETEASALELTPIDVPAALFDATGDDEGRADAREELRALLLEQHGWVLGAPSWIQDPVGSDDDFVMQFGGDLGRDFGTADQGEVYVFTDHVLLQSH